MEGGSTISSSEIRNPNVPNHIFILSGQSNMAGRAGVIKDHNLNRWVWDKIVPRECTPNPLILRLSSDLHWEEAHEPLHADIDTAKVCGVCPGMAFANAVKKHLETASVIGLVPCAVGGTAIKEWERGSHLYEKMVERAKESKKCGGEIKAALWYQGESDCLEIHDAETYRSNMERLSKNLRDDLGLPSLPFIQVALASGGGYIEKVREAQLGLNLPNAVCVDAKGLQLKSDNLHLTTESQVKLGLSLAQAYLSTFC